MVHLSADPEAPDVEVVDADTEHAVAVDVDAETVARWQEVIAAYRDVQREMWAAYREALSESRRA